MSAELAHRVQMAFDRCNAFPETGAQNGIFHVRGDAYLALIELRNMCPEIALALLSVGKIARHDVSDRGNDAGQSIGV